MRCPPSFEWRELVSGLKVCHHSVDQLHPKIDYVFRVRAVNEYGLSEPSLPVSLYRPRKSGLFISHHNGQPIHRHNDSYNVILTVKFEVG